MSEIGAEIHNEEAGRLIREIMRPTLASGGTMTDVFVLMESILLGFVLMNVKLGGDEVILDTLMSGVKGRLAEHRLGGRPSQGSA
jgi:hypothetical protein